MQKSGPKRAESPSELMDESDNLDEKALKALIRAAVSMNSKPRPQSKLAALDAVFKDRQGEWWDTFYADRGKPVPFFVGSPDESLCKWVDGNMIPRGRALDLGCGNGRNAVYLARSGFTVDAVDYSGVAIEWAAQQAKEAGVDLRLHHASVFDLQLTAGSYDFIYDSGCFHHMPPHRRSPYVALVADALRPGGLFGMTCFRPEGGSGFSDDEAYERKTLGGGLGYTDTQLQAFWSDRLKIRELRQMEQPPAGSKLFGLSFLWALLAQREG